VFLSIRGRNKKVLDRKGSGRKGEEKMLSSKKNVRSTPFYDQRGKKKERGKKGMGIWRWKGRRQKTRYYGNESCPCSTPAKRKKKKMRHESRTGTDKKKKKIHKKGKRKV